ncbi:MAG: hypothetical protein ACXVJL_15960 [Candidatus Angelobacter sp.]
MAEQRFGSPLAALKLAAELSGEQRAVLAQWLIERDDRNVHKTRRK